MPHSLRWLRQNIHPQAHRLHPSIRSPRLLQQIHCRRRAKEVRGTTTVKRPSTPSAIPSGPNTTAASSPSTKTNSATSTKPSPMKLHVATARPFGPSTTPSPSHQHGLEPSATSHLPCPRLQGHRHMVRCRTAPRRDPTSRKSKASPTSPKPPSPKPIPASSTSNDQVYMPALFAGHYPSFPW